MSRLWSGLFCCLVVAGLVELRDTAAVAQGNQQIVWIVRHGEKDTKEKGEVLTEAGWKRARLLAEKLASENVGVIITSPVTRTIETGTPLEERLGDKVEVFRLAVASDVASKVKESKGKGNVLVVHHSEKLSDIVKELRKTPLKQDVCGYDRLYKLNMGASPPRLEVSQFGAKTKGCPPLAKAQ